MTASTLRAAEHDLVEGLLSTLQSLPGVSAFVVEDEPRSRSVTDVRVDARIMLEVLGRQVQILVEAKAYGYPRDLRDSAMQLRHYASLGATALIAPMIVADAISPGARELLRREGVGYWDRSGSLYLKLPWALYYVDRPQQLPAPRVVGALYRGSAAQVLHALLLEPNREWHVQELAARAEVSVSRTHQVLAQLEQHLWVEVRGRGPRTVRALVEPGALLDSWAEEHSLEEYSFRRYYGWSQSPAALRSAVTAALDRHAIPYALTLTSGTELIAPFVTGSERLTVLVPDHPALEQATTDAGLSAVEDGENVALLVTRARAPLLFRQQVDTLEVASTVQLYLDLWASPRRGKEQARHLRAERMLY